MYGPARVLQRVYSSPCTGQPILTGTKKKDMQRLQRLRQDSMSWVWDARGEYGRTGLRSAESPGGHSSRMDRRAVCTESRPVRCRCVPPGWLCSERQILVRLVSVWRGWASRASPWGCHMVWHFGKQAGGPQSGRVWPSCCTGLFTAVAFLPGADCGMCSLPHPASG